jgi:hypothetical protein
MGARDTIFDKTAVTDHVAIDEHDVVACEGGDRAVPRSRETKPKVLLLHLLRHAGKLCIAAPARTWPTGTIIGQKHFREE